MRRTQTILGFLALLLSGNVLAHKASRRTSQDAFEVLEEHMASSDEVRTSSQVDVDAKRTLSSSVGRLAIEYLKAMKGAASYWQSFQKKHANGTLPNKAVFGDILSNWTAELVAVSQLPYTDFEHHCPDLQRYPWELESCVRMTNCYVDASSTEVPATTIALMAESEHNTLRIVMPQIFNATNSFPKAELLGCPNNVSTMLLQRRLGAAELFSAKCVSAAATTEAMLQHANSTLDSLSAVWQGVCRSLGCNSRSWTDIVHHLSGHVAALIEEKASPAALRLHISAMRRAHDAWLQALTPDRAPILLDMVQAKQGASTSGTVAVDRYDQHVQHMNGVLETAEEKRFDKGEISKRMKFCFKISLVEAMGFVKSVGCDAWSYFLGVIVNLMLKVSGTVDLTEATTELLHGRVGAEVKQTTGLTLQIGVFAGFCKNAAYDPVGVRAGIAFSGNLPLAPCPTCSANSWPFSLSLGFSFSAVVIAGAPLGIFKFIFSYAGGFTMLCCSIDLATGEQDCAPDLFASLMRGVTELFKSWGDTRRRRVGYFFIPKTYEENPARCITIGCGKDQVCSPQIQECDHLEDRMKFELLPVRYEKADADSLELDGDNGAKCDGDRCEGNDEFQLQNRWSDRCLTAVYGFPKWAACSTSDQCADGLSCYEGDKRCMADADCHQAHQGDINNRCGRMAELGQWQSTCRGSRDCAGDLKCREGDRRCLTDGDCGWAHPGERRRRRIRRRRVSDPCGHLADDVNGNRNNWEGCSTTADCRDRNAFCRTGDRRCLTDSDCQWAGGEWLKSSICKQMPRTGAADPPAYSIVEQHHCDKYSLNQRWFGVMANSDTGIKTRELGDEDSHVLQEREGDIVWETLEEHGGKLAWSAGLKAMEVEQTEGKVTDQKALWKRVQTDQGDRRRGEGNGRRRAGHCIWDNAERRRRCVNGNYR